MIQKYTNLNNPAHPLLKPCGLDALWVSIAQTERLHPEFEELRKQAAKPNQRKEDYRPYGLPIVVIRPETYFPLKSSRIVQVKGVGQMDAQSILEALDRVVQRDPLELRVHRVDLTADWIGGTIGHCRNNVKGRLKRKTAEYWNPNYPGDSYQTGKHDSAAYESLYFGSPKSLDFLRVYDKPKQLRKEADIPAETEIPPLWVRFERVLMRDGVPEELRTLTNLLTNGANFDPFNNVEINNTPGLDPDLLFGWQGPGVTLNKQQNAMWTLRLVQRLGRAEAAKRIRAWGRKPDEMFALMNWAVSDTGIPTPEPSDLTAMYQRAFHHQMFGDVEQSL